MRELFVPRAFNKGSRVIIRQANEIIDEYRERGFVLTLRQIFYQFVHRNLIANKQSEYKRLGSIINDARLAAKIDWEMIEDRTRGLEGLPWWSRPQDGIDALADQFRTDIWLHQPVRVEVWIEKEALTGVVEPACNDFRVPFFACRGYTSQSEEWRAGHRFRRYLKGGQKVLILHLGDHDPSGFDMTEDNLKRLVMFAKPYSLRMFEFRRIALNMDQINEFDIPPNPLKRDAQGNTTDSRAAGYAKDFGDESWELDALDPTTIDGLIRQHIEPLIDRVAWDQIEREEAEVQTQLKTIVRRYDEILYLTGKPDYE